jgi:hypothetical protein
VKRDESRDISVDRVSRARSARHRNARGCAWVGAKLAGALSLLPRGFYRVEYLEGNSSVWKRWVDREGPRLRGAVRGMWRRTAARGGGGTHVVALYATIPNVGCAASAVWRRLRVRARGGACRRTRSPGGSCALLIGRDEEIHPCPQFQLVE